MAFASLFAIIAAVLLVAKWLAQLWLERLNQQHVRAHAHNVPDAFKDYIDAQTYGKSVEYTLAKSKFSEIELTFTSALILIVLFSGVLPWAFDLFLQNLGSSAWSMAGFLFAVGFALALAGMPFDWYDQFQLEERFGFNTTTSKLWWLDRLKGFLLGFLLGYPLIVLILKLVDWTGPWWWLWAWGCLMIYQILMLILAPILILPLFNKFTPLPESSLRERLLTLANRTGFQAKSIQVMDGSKRSRHSNAFFTGFGRFRKIVLFDTLLQQLSDPEIEAVLAHEIGHYKKRHIPKMFIWSTVSLFLTFLLLALLAEQAWFYEAFGFERITIVPALLLFGLLSGLFSFWFSPLANWWSRRYEYQADSYAAEAVRTAQPLIGALRKLSEKNLSNLSPHKLYSRFYYSHPTLIEREGALAAEQQAP